MAYVHLGHDCAVANHCILANYSGLAGHVTLEDYVTLGGMTGVSQFIRVGAHAYVGGQSGVEKDVPPFCIAIGSRPCNIKGTNIVGLRRRGFSAEIITRINEVDQALGAAGRAEGAVPARDRSAVRRDPGDPGVRLVHPRERSGRRPVATPATTAGRVRIAVKILISAAEASSDTHGAALLRALREELGGGDRHRAFGIGGPGLQAEGLRAVVDARGLLSMGFLEIVVARSRAFSARCARVAKAARVRAAGRRRRDRLSGFSFPPGAAAEGPRDSGGLLHSAQGVGLAALARARCCASASRGC